MLAAAGLIFKRMKDEPLVVFDGRLHVSQRQRFVVTMRDQNASRAIEVSRMIPLEAGDICSIRHHSCLEAWGGVSLGLSHFITLGDPPSTSQLVSIAPKDLSHSNSNPSSSTPARISRILS